MTPRLGLRSPSPHRLAQHVGASIALADALRLAPASVDYQSALHLDAAAPDALGNLDHNDCVEAGYLRQLQMRLAAAEGSTWQPATPLAISLYAAWSGFDPATGTGDDGTDLAAAQIAAARNGIAFGPDLDVPLPVSLPNDPDALRAATFWFGSIGICWALPAYLESLIYGDVWDVAPAGTAGTEPGSFGYHYTASGGCTAAERRIITWGREVLVTPAFEGLYRISAEAQLSHRWCSVMGRTPAGWDWAQTDALLQAFG